MTCNATDFAQIEKELLTFVRSNAGPNVVLTRDTPLFGNQGVLDSLSLLSLILLLEQLLGRELQPVEFSDPSRLASIGNLVEAFWSVQQMGK